MSNKTKKGKNPGAVDNWLDSIGLYRKNVAYDETCLFRAVSEQLFDCQIFHERVRRECIEYGRRNPDEFWPIFENNDDWFAHLDLLEKHMVISGNPEIQVISRKYNRDVLVYDAAKQQLFDATNRNLEETLMLCLMNEDHYDVIYKREYIQNAGFCQSIVYGILYENVFKIPNVQQIVHGMLYEKEFVAASFTEITNNFDLKICDESDEKRAVTPPVNIAPFPFKVAKALDSTIYRNIEYDSWTEVRREMRLGDWYYGDDNLILGTRCILNDINGDTFECYIQEIIKTQNKCIVYITRLAEKRTVNYSDLSPENDAKPWPLPYRFSKNLNVSTPNQTPEKTLKLPKKRKDKKRVKSNSESSTPHLNSHLNNSEAGSEQDVKAFIGVPLQMQDNTVPTYTTQVESPTGSHETSLSQHNLLVTPDIPSPMPKFSWETPWNSVIPGTANQVVWSHPSGTPPNVGNFNMRPMIASAPVTPDVVSYHDTHYPYLYNYHVENYPSYNSWNVSTDYNNTQSHENTTDSESTKERTDLDNSGQYSSYNESYESQTPRERPTLCTSVPATSPQVEIFSPIIPIPPGTPMIYTHTPEVTEMLVPGTPVQVYTPPIDVQYVTSGSYIYPPTPPPWYPPGINSQGFIFPAAAVNPNISK